MTADAVQPWQVLPLPSSTPDFGSSTLVVPYHSYYLANNRIGCVLDLVIGVASPGVAFSSAHLVLMDSGQTNHPYDQAVHHQ